MAAHQAPRVLNVVDELQRPLDFIVMVEFWDAADVVHAPGVVRRWLRPRANARWARA